MATNSGQQREKRAPAPSAKVLENQRAADALKEPPSRRPMRKDTVLVPAAMIEKMYIALLELKEELAKERNIRKEEIALLAEEKRLRKEETAALVAELGVLKKAFLDSQSRVPTWAQMVASGSPTILSASPSSGAQVSSISLIGSRSSEARDLHTITVMMDKINSQAAQEIDF
jgi:hypothetical protein